MSNRRKIRPHELARRDQAYAAAAQVTAEGGLSVVADEAPPAVQCSWCDCPDWRSPSSPHARPGYVCPHPCTAESVFLVRITGGGRERLVPLCRRHHDGDFLDDIVVHCPGLEIIPAWMDADYEL